MEQLEEYPSTEQINAVASPPNDGSQQPDQSSSSSTTTTDRSTVDSELLNLIRNDAVPFSSSSTVNEKSSEQERMSSDKNVRGKARASSSQNVVSSTSESVSTSYTLPELAEQEESGKTKAATIDVLVNAINGGLSNLKSAPNQVSVLNR